MDGSSTSRAGVPAAKTARWLRTGPRSAGNRICGTPGPERRLGTRCAEGTENWLGSEIRLFQLKTSPAAWPAGGAAPRWWGSPSPGYLRGHPAVPERPVRTAVGEQQLSLSVKHPVLQLAPVLGARRQRVGALSLHPAGDRAVGRGRAGGSPPPRRAHLLRTVPPRYRPPVSSMAARPDGAAASPWQRRGAAGTQSSAPPPHSPCALPAPSGGACAVRRALGDAQGERRRHARLAAGALAGGARCAGGE